MEANATWLDAILEAKGQLFLLILVMASGAFPVFYNMRKQDNQKSPPLTTTGKVIAVVFIAATLVSICLIIGDKREEMNDQLAAEKQRLADANQRATDSDRIARTEQMVTDLQKQKEELSLQLEETRKELSETIKNERN